MVETCPTSKGIATILSEVGTLTIKWLKPALLQKGLHDRGKGIAWGE
jgi:hypothetical protein